jgi:peptidoglycan/LPS O-acetylase OafA/YrhL
MDRGNNFDLLRLLAALSVIFSHAFLLGEGRQDIEPLMILTGGQTILGVVGVFVFFVISGFLVTMSFVETRSAPRFLAKRALRIYPGFIVCLLLSALCLGPALTSLPLAEYFRAPDTGRYVIWNLLMDADQNSLPGVWFSGFGAGNVVDGPLWTLPCEILMYLMVCTLGMARLLSLPAVVLLIIGGMVCVWFDTTSIDGVWPSTGWLLPFFAAGMALYLLKDKGIFRPAIAFAAALGLIAATALHLLLLLFPIFGGYLIVYVALEKRLPVIRAARWGDLSYGLYIYGWPVEQTIVRLSGGQAPWEKVFVLGLPVTAALAFLSWHLVEKRALALKPGKRPRSPARTKQNKTRNPARAKPIRVARSGRSQ